MWYIVVNFMRSRHTTEYIANVNYNYKILIQTHSLEMTHLDGRLAVEMELEVLLHSEEEQFQI